METDEILRRSRRTMYGSGASSVPAGVLTSGTEPMPARSSFIDRPAPTSDPRLIERMRARPTVDPEVGRRLSSPSVIAEGVQRPSGGAETRPITIDRMDPSRRAPPAGGSPPAGGGPPGVIRSAAGRGAGRITSALQSPTGRVVRGAAGATGAMMAYPTAAMAYDNLVNQPGAPAKALGAAQALLAGSAALPGPLGELGRLGNLGYQAIINSDLPARISRAARSALNMKDDAGESAPVGASSNPSKLIQQIPTDRGTTGSAARVPSPVAAAVARPGLGEPVVVGERSPGPIAKAAQKRAPSNQPVGEPAPKAPPVVSPPAVPKSPVEQGGIQVFGPHNGYAGAQRDSETPGMYYLPEWDGDNIRPAPADGEVFVTRGGGVGSQQNIFSSKTGVERADMPPLEGTSVEQLVRFMAATQGSSDARVAAANKAAADLLRAQLDSDAAAERQRVASEASVKSAGISAGGGVRQAEIQSAANRYLYQPGQRVTDMMGNTTYTDPAVFDRQTGTPLPGKTKPTKPVRPMAARSQMIKLVADREGVDDRTAEYLVDQAFEFVK